MREPRQASRELKPLLTVPFTFIAAWMVSCAIVLGIYGLIALSN